MLASANRDEKKENMISRLVHGEQVRALLKENDSRNLPAEIVLAKTWFTSIFDFAL